MVKNSKTSKKSNSTSRSYLIQRYTVPVLLTLLIVAILALATCVKTLSDRVDQLDNSHMQDVLVDSLADIAQPVSTDPATGEVFFHEARVQLPAAPDGLRFQYSYTPASDDGNTPAVIELNNPSEYHIKLLNLQNARSVEDTFAKLPQLQWCSRAYRLVFGTASEENYTLKNTVHLSDGRMVSIYEHEKCNLDSDELLPYFAKLQSY